MQVIGLVGRMAAGKDTAARYLHRRLGAPVLQMSDPLFEEARDRDVPSDREHLGAISRQLREEEGDGVLAERAADRAEALDDDVPAAVVCGLRAPADIARLRDRFGGRLCIVHVRVDDPHLRFERARRRDAERDPEEFETFREQDEREVETFDLCEATDAADVVVHNDGSLHHLHEQLEQCVVQPLLSEEGSEVLVSWLEDLDADDTPRVGGKNSSLGEMISALADRGIRVPDGFATTAHAYRTFLEHNDLEPVIEDGLPERGEDIRQAIEDAAFPDALADAITEAYRQLCEREEADEVAVAVRSSATAEDLPDASFAGQQESFLNVRGPEALLDACRRCYASLFTDRAISYREQQGFDHLDVALSVGVQAMVRADEAGSGVAFSIDTDTGFPDLVLINAAWGLGESVVQGTVDPDQYRVFKPFLDEDKGGHPVVQRICGAKEHAVVYADEGETTEIETEPDARDRFVLSDEQIVELAHAVRAIEDHYGQPMDIEWALDGEGGPLTVVQARPETVQSQRERGTLRTWSLDEHGEALLTGLAVGTAIGAGPVCRIASPDDQERFEEGGVLVTERTDPDWVPLMERAAAIVTEQGGRTSHAAIVSRELGVPALVGATGARERLADGQVVTVDCSEGDRGTVYDGELAFDSEEIDLSALPETRTDILMNVASPTAALTWWQLPVRGIGLARMEYLVNDVIGVHPMALVHPDRVDDDETREAIEAKASRYDEPEECFVDQLAQGIALVAAARWPDRVLVRTSDFKSNEYADLLGGRWFEPDEENPMLGWRGASRYVHEDYREAFDLECRALRRVREELGFTNVAVMIPFCRTPQEADAVLEAMADRGLIRGRGGLEVYVMAEIPSNIIEADAFAERFDGFSIGSNDLTQLCLGVSRDAERLSHLFDEGSPTVRWMIRELVLRAAGLPVGLCGQGPSDRPELAGFLVEAGLTSISVDPDSVARVIEHVAAAEQRGS